MKQVIRQVFGSTRPRDIWLDLFTFNRLLSKPIVHIIYWCGLGLLLISACGVLGVAIGQAIKDGSVMGWVLSLPVLIIGWLSILICIMLWRAACEFFLAVLSIAEDLSALRAYQEKLEQPNTQAAPQPQPQPRAEAEAEYDVQTEQAAAPASTPGQAPTVDDERNILEDPFFRPRFERRDI
ncbi:hypothetical protein ABAC460_05665 [Asticcacaulis sp. AC460]|uniref:DUF4282 domain-containing protein n=1 Tax=Asticcacaulis sp. AC460 TaxID=1282360 RepID=UPI0003C3EB40|nr:DUF4282 domain-containing protein [Asticcacaulis sp. AC460]ESQ91470.1 hypothetical protein ABAC460_05665 [Asticcacaulis sp. AC460]